MGREGTADEYRADLVAAMGEEVGALFCDLSDEFAWARSKWQEYEELFGAPEKVDLLNRAAPAFFGSLQRTLLDDILLHLCRLTDPATMRGHDNLSLDQLLKRFPDRAFAGTLQPLRDDVERKTGMARAFRNKRGAHTDLKVVRGEDALPGISRRDVREALEAIAALFAKVRDKYSLAEESFEVIEALGGVDALLDRLRRGVAAREEELNRLRGR